MIDKDSTSILGALAGVGAAIGVAQILYSEEKITLRRTVGKAIVTAGLSMSAGSALAFVPGLGAVALVGLSAAIATVGTEGLFKLMSRAIDKKIGNE